MKYQEFINLIQQHQTTHIKTVAFHGCCNMDEIPDVLASHLPEVVQILEHNIRLLCAENQVLVIIGMQIGPPMLESKLPLKLGRIYSEHNPFQHFCVVLQYLLLTPEQLKEGVASWYGSETLMIDFTIGDIMDAERYLSLMLNKSAKGICYGQLSQHHLATSWRQMQKNTPSKTLAEPAVNYLKQKNNLLDERFMAAVS